MGNLVEGEGRGRGGKGRERGLKEHQSTLVNILVPL